MLTRRIILKWFVGSLALLGFGISNQCKLKTGKVRKIKKIIGLYDVVFGNHKVCMTKNHVCLITRNNQRIIVSVNRLKIGDMLHCPKYLTEPQ